jgi:hypothetical protein
MLSRKAWVRRLGAALAVAAAAAMLPAGAGAQGDIASGAMGYDISFPQCDQANPSLNQGFGVVGINNGTPFTQNPCLGAEYGWALSAGVKPQVYMNLQYGEIPVGQLGCDLRDRGCMAYNYGWAAAADAYTRAMAGTLGGAHVASWWWLDVETENNWDPIAALNSEVIRGAIDFFHGAGRQVGVYSTPAQYWEITNGFIPYDTGNWVVASGPGDTAALHCQLPLWPGAHVWQVQWIDPGLNIDRNRAC